MFYSSTPKGKKKFIDNITPCIGGLGVFYSSTPKGKKKCIDNITPCIGGLGGCSCGKESDEEKG